MSPTARVLQAAFTDWAAEHPEQAGELPWAWLSDPRKLAEFRRRDAEAHRIRRALEDGAEPEALGLVEGGLEKVLRERGLA